jgi:hypothetical protein
MPSLLHTPGPLRGRRGRRMALPRVPLTGTRLASPTSSRPWRCCSSTSAVGAVSV